MDVHQKLAQIRETVESARSMPMSASAVVNRGELLDLLDELREALDDALAASRSVVASRDGVVDEGRKEADLIIHEAELQRDRLVSDTEVFRLAQYKAETMLGDAKTEAEALRAETDEYVDAKLANFEITLERTLEAVKRGRERLLGGLMNSLTPEEADKIVMPKHLEE